MEYLDILDSNGSPTGKTKSKSEVHRDGDWHKAVHIWIMNSKNELLVQKRAAIKDSYPNLWDIPSAGHISAGENSINSAIRETEEELGLKFSKEDFELLFTVTQEAVINNGTYINKEFNDVFLIRTDLDLSKLKLQPEEVSEVKFVPWKELEAIISKGGEGFVRHEDEYRKLFGKLHELFP